MSPVLVAAGPHGPAVALPATLHLSAPLPGLPGHDEYTLTALDEIGLLFSMRSEPDDELAVRLFVIAPGPFFPDYTPAITADVRASIGADMGNAVPLVVVRPADGDLPPTANLLAPLVVDLTSGNAVQTVLDGDWPLRAPLG